MTPDESCNTVPLKLFISHFFILKICWVKKTTLVLPLCLLASGMYYISFFLLILNYFFPGHKLYQHKTAPHFSWLSWALPAKGGGGGSGAVGSAAESLAEGPGRTKTERSAQKLWLGYKKEALMNTLHYVCAAGSCEPDGF